MIKEKRDSKADVRHLLNFHATRSPTICLQHLPRNEALPEPSNPIRDHPLYLGVLELFTMEADGSHDLVYPRDTQATLPGHFRHRDACHYLAFPRDGDSVSIKLHFYT
jgi:hypothetical protein